jgi:hypothetical protein
MWVSSFPASRRRQARTESAQIVFFAWEALLPEPI